MPRVIKVFDEDGSFNPNTTPFDITGLDGDLFDYPIVIFSDVDANNADWEITFNNDVTTNYRNYYMRGDGSTASASTSDSDNEINLGLGSYSYPSLGIFNITGDSSGERPVSGLGSSSNAASDTKVQTSSYYWKDSVSKLTSIQISRTVSSTIDCHIIVYRIPKTSSQGGWQKVETLNWAAESSEKSFTGLDGDVDEKYKIVWAGGTNIDIRFNSDSGSNYVRQFLRNLSGSISSGLSTTSSIFGQGTNEEILINSISGANRLINSSSTNTSSNYYKWGYWWINSADNMSSINCTPSVSTNGTATLYRKSPISRNEDIFPYKLIDIYPHNGTDFSSGHTFNFSGDDFKLIKLEVIGESGTANEIRFQFNSDTSSVYNEQRLRGQSSTVSSNNSIRTYGILTTDTEAQGATFTMYPKTGADRPILLESSYGENTVQKSAIWYEDSVTEITSLKVFGSTTATVDATFKLWGLR